MGRRRGLLGLFYALIGVFAIAVGILFWLTWLASFHPAVAIGAFVLGCFVLVVLMLDRLLNARSRFSMMRGFVSDYEALVSIGRDARRQIVEWLVHDVGSVVVITVVVLGWAVVGLLVAIVSFLPGIVLGPDSPLVSLGTLGIWAFFGCLVIGPPVTFRRLWRR